MQMPTSAQDDFHQSPLIHGEDGHPSHAEGICLTILSGAVITAKCVP